MTLLAACSCFIQERDALKAMAANRASGSAEDNSDDDDDEDVVEESDVEDFTADGDISHVAVLLDYGGRKAAFKV